MPDARRRPRRVFISYRREDELIARLLRKYFADRYGRDNVFLDLESISAGAQFAEKILHELAKSDLVVALVGPSWVQLIQKAAIEEVDYVRAEIAQALELHKLIVPVCIPGPDGAKVADPPKAEQIHFQVRGMLAHQMHSLPELNDAQIERLLDEIDRSFAQREDLKAEVQRLDEVSPAAGLALGYFVNFVREVIRKIHDPAPETGLCLNDIEVAEHAGGPIIHKYSNVPADREALRLNIVIPPSVSCLRRDRMEPVFKQLHQASIATRGTSRPFAVHAWRNGDGFQLVDFPTTIGVFHNWIQRRLPKDQRNPETPPWKEMETEEIKRFELLLKWWIEDPANDAGFSDRVRLIPADSEEFGLSWLKKYWRS